MAFIRLGRGGVGLDVGTSAVRAAEIRGGSPPTMVRTGQVLLPRGAVVEGEVQEPDTVARALVTLWKRGQFGSRSVYVGVSNLNVVVRQLVFPAMPRDDLAGAIRHTAQDQIPINLDEAVMDFQVIDEFLGEEGEPQHRVLVVAALREMIDSLLLALRGAKLQAEGIDLNAYPLVRALSRPDPLSDNSEAIVDIGAGVTNVIVQRDSKVRFVRPLRSGGDRFTQALVDAMSLSWEDAESLKHRAGSSLTARAGGEAADEEDIDDETERAADILLPQLQRFTEEIRGSLDYYSQTEAALPTSRVVLTGGGSLLGGTLERLAVGLRMEVERGRPLAGVRLGKIQLEPDQVPAVEPFLGVAVGLGLGSLED